MMTVGWCFDDSCPGTGIATFLYHDLRLTAPPILSSSHPPVRIQPGSDDVPRPPDLMAHDLFLQTRTRCEDLMFELIDNKIDQVWLFFS